MDKRRDNEHRPGPRDERERGRGRTSRLVGYTHTYIHKYKLNWPLSFRVALPSSGTIPRILPCFVSLAYLLPFTNRCLAPDPGVTSGTYIPTYIHTHWIPGASRLGCCERFPLAAVTQRFTDNTASFRVVKGFLHKSHSFQVPIPT